jgi:hypothetical protein
MNAQHPATKENENMHFMQFPYVSNVFLESLQASLALMFIFCRYNFLLQTTYVTLHCLDIIFFVYLLLLSIPHIIVLKGTKSHHLPPCGGPQKQWAGLPGNRQIGVTD